MNTFILINAGCDLPIGLYRKKDFVLKFDHSRMWKEVVKTKFLFEGIKIKL